MKFLKKTFSCLSITCLSITLAHGATVFQETFDAAPLDTSKWYSRADVGVQYFDDGRYFFENTSNATNPWGSNVIVSEEAWARSMGGDGLIFQWDVVAAADFFWMFGFVPSEVPANDYISWNLDQEYWWHGISDGRFFYDNFFVSSTGIPFPLVPPDRYTCRITLDPSRGALWQYNLNDGNGWVTGRDSRGGPQGDQSPEYRIALSFAGEGSLALGDQCDAPEVFEDFAGSSLDTSEWTLGPVNTNALTYQQRCRIIRV